ncbi:MAG TPA: EAL domain-containing protein [Candidatus Acidoferrales bacterium]|nr:EAL domain-containing protein [Candidatus Acidoferrales bacterium]
MRPADRTRSNGCRQNPGELGSTDDGFRVEWLSNISPGIERLHAGGIGAVLLDLSERGSDGVEEFDKIFQAAPHVPILILSNADVEEMAKTAVRRGARGYLVKEQSDGYRLSRTVREMMVRHLPEKIAQENESARTMLDAIEEAVLRTDVHGDVTYLNRAGEAATGWKRAEAYGRPVAEVLKLIERGRTAEGEIVPVTGTREMMTVLEMVDACVNCVLVRRDEQELGVDCKVTLVRDEGGNVTGRVVTFRDVSRAHATAMQMSHLAQHDPLTDLPNRVLFNDRLTQAISLAERQGTQLAVMFIDIDRFKRINDSLGHEVGDQILQSVAARLLACVRRSDTVSRLGGDEFIILLSQMENAADAAFSARKVLRAFARPHIIDNRSLDVNASIGVSAYPADGLTAESLMNRADDAMYEAKQGGRNSYRLFRPEMHAQLAERQSLESELRCALGRNEFLLHYQPKFKLGNGEITGVEALIRWLHPQRGMILPSDFVPIAEESRLILPIGQWVLREACRQAREWNDLGLGIVPVAVNVSAAEFEAGDFLSGVRAALIATKVEPQNLELELTETVLMRDADNALAKMVALKAMGVRLAIDDFGTGYSSFAYLQRFPTDALKLDQSFVQQITSGMQDTTILNAMIDLGKSLKQRVIAEGVETGAQLDFLRLHECDEGQGYYFSRPVSAEQAATFFKAHA